MTYHKKGVFARRDFLNTGYHHSKAVIYSKVMTEWGDHFSHVHTDLDISDCHDSISLSLEVAGSKSQYKNTIRKMDVIIHHLQELKKACGKARAIHEERMIKVREYKRQQKAKKKKDKDKNNLENE